MSLYKRPGSDMWWCNIRHRGRRIRRSLGTADEEVANRKHDELKARLWKAKQAGKQLSDALLVWTTEKERGGSDLRALKLIRATYKDRPLIEVTNASLLDTFGDKKPATYNRLVNIIRAAMNMALARGWIEDVEKYERRKPADNDADPDERHLTAKEWDAVRAELPAHLEIMARFAVATGLRWSNVAGMEWHRIDLRRKLAWIPGPRAKGKRPIPIPLSHEAIAVLRAIKGPREGYVFTYHGQPIKSAKTAWRAARKRAGLDKLRFHDLRHTWASWHAMNGTPLDVLQKLGAWETRVVERYAHLSPSYVAQYADNAKPVGKTAGAQSKVKRSA